MYNVLYSTMSRTHTERSDMDHTVIYTYIHTNLYTAKIVKRIWGADWNSGRMSVDILPPFHL